ncbi:MAG TPA: winged helix-turn-helix domain-containing protein [Vicinamibacteria bacterium]|nr:winged helix-turn-helix domain-containing protein [Vicinamibacteria bacterium]
MEAPPSRPTYRFGEFEFDPASGELHKAGSKVRLQEQPCQILSLLLSRPGEVVTREEVRHALWPGDTFVDFDMGLNSAIKRLRDALEDSADHPRYVETLPRRGYRFVAALAPSAVAPAAPPDVATPPRTSAFPAGRTLAAAALIATVVVGLAFRASWLRGRGQDTAPSAIRSLAVLPFENLTGSADQDYFVDGMTDALITDLAQARALRVISRTSVMRYKGTTKSLPRVAEELGVDAVVEGTVARAGDRVRITAQLIQATTDRHLWAQSYEREVRDVLGLQREVAAAVAQAIQVKLQPEARPRLARAHEVEPEAYEAYLKGRYYWGKRSPADTLKAVDAFQAAIGRDPDYAPAHAGLSDAYRSFDVQGLGAPRDVMPRAEAAARKALALDDSLAEAHASLAGVLYRYHWDWEGAEKEFRISLDLDPGSAEIHRAYAVYLMTMRRHEEALAEAQRARELSPLSPVINAELGTALVRLGRCDEAVAGLHKTLEIDPESVRLYQTLGEAYDAKGQWLEGLAALEKSDTLSPAPYPWLGFAYGMAGRRREALEVLARLDRASRERFVSPQSFAVVHLGLGDRGQALFWLEKAYDQHAFEVLGFSGEIYDQLRDDPRFQDLLRRMRLPIAGDPAPRRHASLLMRPHG